MSQVLDRVRNGGDTAQMYGTLDAIKSDPSLARFQFRDSNRWIDGAHNRSTIQGFYGAGQEDGSRAQAFSLDAGEPAVLLGVDMDVRGCLGISDEVRNGFNRIQVTFQVKGDAPAEKLREVVERAQARSAVFDMVSHGVPVEVGVVTN